MSTNKFCMVFGIVTLLGFNVEMYGSEKGNLAPYVVGTVVVGTSLLIATQTKTYQTFSNHQARLAREKEESSNPLLYAEALSENRSDSHTSIMSNKAQAFLQQCEEQRRAEAQKCATKITKETLQSHIRDDYAGERTK